MTISIIFVGLFIFILGTLIGSFLNVVILRYNTGMTLGGRSGCFSCSKRLAWYELVPIASWLAQKGRCRGCGARISWQYPLVEALTGLMFVAVFWREIGVKLVATMTLFGTSNLGFGAFAFTPVSALLLVPLIFYWIIFSLLIVILVYDLRHKIIPDALVYVFSALSLVWVLFHSNPAMLSATVWQAILAGPILFVPFFLLWLVSRGRWIGLGDGKLALGTGWLLGLTLGASALVYAFWLGAVASLILLAFRGRRFTMKSEIPFAPFIIVAIFLTYYFRINVLDLIAAII